MDIQHPGGVNEDIHVFSMATVMFGTLDLGSLFKSGYKHVEQCILVETETRRCWLDDRVQHYGRGGEDFIVRRWRPVAGALLNTVVGVDRLIICEE